jgi:hypothetical protein
MPPMKPVPSASPKPEAIGVHIEEATTRMLEPLRPPIDCAPLAHLHGRDGRHTPIVHFHRYLSAAF